jgi:hypothetical protein
MLEPHAPELIAKVVERALEGDTTALRIAMDRLLPRLPAGAVRIAGAFAVQCVDAVPAAAHDLAVDVLVTPSATLRPASA